MKQRAFWISIVLVVIGMGAAVFLYQPARKPSVAAAVNRIIAEAEKKKKSSVEALPLQERRAKRFERLTDFEPSENVRVEGEYMTVSSGQDLAELPLPQFVKAGAAISPEDELPKFLFTALAKCFFLEDDSDLKTLKIGTITGDDFTFIAKDLLGKSPNYSWNSINIKQSRIEMYPVISGEVADEATMKQIRSHQELLPVMARASEYVIIKLYVGHAARGWNMCSLQFAVQQDGSIVHTMISNSNLRTM